MKLKVTASKSKSTPSIKATTLVDTEVDSVEAAIIRKALIEISFHKAASEFSAIIDGRPVVQWVDGEEIMYGVKSKGSSESCVVELLYSPADDVDPSHTYPINGYRLSGKTIVIASAALAEITLEEFARKAGKFDERRHPRDNSGRFSSGNSESQSKDDEGDEDEEENDDEEEMEDSDYESKLDSIKNDTMSVLDDAYASKESELYELRDVTPQSIIDTLNNSEAGLGEFSSRSSDKDLAKAIEKHLGSDDFLEDDVIASFYDAASSDLESEIDEDELYDADDDAVDTVEAALNEWVVDKLVEIVRSTAKGKSSKAPLSLVPTEGMAAEARRGLEWRKEFKRGGTLVGVARARDLSNRSELSESTIGRMVSYFARHEVDKKAEGFRQGEKGFPSAGRIAWALWGGDVGKTWAESMQERIKKRKESKGYYGKDKDKKEYMDDKDEESKGKDYRKKEYDKEDSEDSDSDESYEEAKTELMSAIRSGKLSKDDSYDDMCGYLKDRGYDKDVAEAVVSKVTDGYKKTKKPIRRKSRQ